MESARRILIALIAGALLLACASSGERAELLVIDLNILHGIGDPEYERLPERLDLIASALAEMKPDVVFLQEVVVSGSGDYPDVRSVLLDALGSGYIAVFGDITGAPVDEGALGQFTLTRLPVVSSENRHIGGPRSAHRVTVETTAGPLDLYNTHLEGTGAVIDVDEGGTISEIETLLAFVAQSDRAAILAGDFNAEPHEAPIQAILRAGFVDAMVAAGDPTCEAASDPGCTSSTRPLSDNQANNASRRIDYMFVRGSDDVALEAVRAEPFLNAPVETGRGLLWASDHIGLLARIVLD